MPPETDFLLARRGPDCLVRRIPRRRRPVSLPRPQRNPRHHRTERRRQDHRAGSDLRPHQSDQRIDQVQGPGTDPHEGARDRPRRHRPEVPDAVDLRRSYGVREPRNLLPPRPLGFRRTRLSPRRRGRDRVEESRAHHLPRRPSGQSRRISQPRSEAMAGDRHAADPGPGLDDAGRTGRRHERQRAQEDRGTAAPGHPAPLRAGDRARHGIRRGHRAQGDGAASVAACFRKVRSRM